MKIEPKDIKTDSHYWDTFDKSEREAAARNIVLASQKHGSWFWFTDTDINIGPWGYWFVAGRYFKQRADGKYHVTPAFVMKLSKYLKKGVVTV